MKNNKPNRNTSKSLTLLNSFLKGCRLFFAAALFGSIINTVFNSLSPQIIRLSIDAVVGNEENYLPAALERLIFSLQTQGIARLLLYAAAAVLLSSLLAGIGNYLYKVCTAKGAEAFAENLRNKLYTHIQRLPLSWHSANQTGDIIQRCTMDTEVIRSFIAGQLTEVFRIIFFIAFALFMMFRMNVTLSLIVLAFIPCVVTYSFIFFKKISSRFLAADEAEGALTADVQENLTGMRVVRAFGRERYETERFDGKNQTFADLWTNLGRTLSLFWGTGDLFTSLQIISVIVCGCIFAANGTITLGTFVAFVSYNSMLVWPIRGLGRILSEMSKSGVSFERLAYILDAQEEDYGSGEKGTVCGDIVFDNVSFAYVDQPVLSGVSFTARQGHTIALLGATGSGKSTIAQLLTRLYELGEGKGSISIGGVDIKDIPLSVLRSSVGLINQEPFLYSRTIGENIAISRPEATYAQIRAAAQAAYIDREILSFEKGYDTLVGERGVTLSGGQKQRVAIARTLLANTPIIVFDDSLSAVDAQTDADIRASIAKNTSDKTVIIISHRITTLMQADSIAVIDEGKIVDFGSHEQLIHKEGLYKSIYNIQLRSDDRALTKEAT